MIDAISQENRVQGALYGLFIGDALAMPVHWYYDTEALRRDYGVVKDYLTPRNPHPDSILWRSSYRPANPAADILHDQAQYWGRRGIHYHQFLKAGENTLNAKLANELLRFLKVAAYSPRKWLEHMVSYLTSPASHQDTYVEEYLRHFFTEYGQGVDLLKCGRRDEHHIGGMTLLLPLVIYFSDEPETAAKSGLEHLQLTHGGTLMERWGALLIDTILPVIRGVPLRTAIETSWRKHLQEAEPDFFYLFDYPDKVVVGKHFSSACYLDQALPATLYLAAKYDDRPEAALIANTMCGGDNCGRGAVLGALLGASIGLTAWPERWRKGLLSPPPVPC
jgi:ADP-ribosyl-[dinitrogen reductase] hydrolase